MIVYGKQVAYHIIEHHPHIVKKIYLAKEIDTKDFSLLKKLKVPIERLDRKKAQALARGGNHQGFLIEIEDIELSSLDDVKEGRFLVILYGVTDVGNIGSIIRTAYALGADGVIVSGVNSLKMEGVVRRSSGAALDMPIVVEPNIYTLIKELKDAKFRIFCADMSGEDVRGMCFEDRRAIILGSEGEGVPKKVLQRSDKALKIVMRRPFDSLNVAAAAAIFIDRMRDE